MDTAEITKDAWAALHAVIDPLVDAGKATLRWETSDNDKPVAAVTPKASDAAPFTMMIDYDEVILQLGAHSRTCELECLPEFMWLEQLRDILTAITTTGYTEHLYVQKGWMHVILTFHAADGEALTLKERNFPARPPEGFSETLTFSGY